MKKSELQLFIIWKNAFDKKDEIIDDMNKKFVIRNIYKVIWNDENWSNNLSRFYGTRLPEGSGKEEHCGKEYFLLIIVEDKNPKYEYRETSHGLEKVNINMFDKKMLYREWTGGGHKIHATNDLKEVNHDLTLLLGKNIDDFKKNIKPNKKIVEYREDIIGSKTWSSIEEIFYVLNNCDNYVVLRDFENNLVEMYNDSNYDVDLLCANKNDTKWILNAKEVFLDNHIQYQINLKDKTSLFDLKYVGDNYYCEEMENDILDNKIMYKGFYVPNDDYLYMANLFHAIIHKNNYETEYNDRLAYIFKGIHDKNKSKEFYIKKLSNWMREKGYVIKVQNENPYKMNKDNIKLFDKGLYNSNIFEEIDVKSNIKTIEIENYNLKKHIENLTNELTNIKTEYNKVISSKGWRILEKMRKLKKDRLI